MQSYDNATMIGVRYNQLGVGRDEADWLRRNFAHVRGVAGAPVLWEHDQPNTVVLERLRPRSRTLRIRLIRTANG